MTHSFSNGEMIRDGEGQLWQFRDDQDYPMWCHFSDEYGVDSDKMHMIPTPHTPMVLLTKKQYDALNQREIFLGFLEQSGVDNWTCYEDAVDNYNAWRKARGL